MSSSTTQRLVCLRCERIMPSGVRDTCPNCRDRGFLAFQTMTYGYAEFKPGKCDIKGCKSKVHIVLIDKDNKPHNACEGHLNEVSLRYLGPDDCLVVEK